MLLGSPGSCGQRSSGVRPHLGSPGTWSGRSSGSSCNDSCKHRMLSSIRLNCEQHAMLPRTEKCSGIKHLINSLIKDVLVSPEGSARSRAVLLGSSGSCGQRSSGVHPRLGWPGTWIGAPNMSRIANVRFVSIPSSTPGLLWSLCAQWAHWAQWAPAGGRQAAASGGQMPSLKRTSGKPDIQGSQRTSFIMGLSAPPPGLINIPSRTVRRPCILQAMLGIETSKA